MLLIQKQFLLGLRGLLTRHDPDHGIKRGYDRFVASTLPLSLEDGAHGGLSSGDINLRNVGLGRFGLGRSRTRRPNLDGRGTGTTLGDDGGRRRVGGNDDGIGGNTRGNNGRGPERYVMALYKLDITIT